MEVTVWWNWPGPRAVHLVWGLGRDLIPLRPRVLQLDTGLSGPCELARLPPSFATKVPTLPWTLPTKQTQLLNSCLRAMRLAERIPLPGRATLCQQLLEAASQKSTPCPKSLRSKFQSQALSVLSEAGIGAFPLCLLEGSVLPTPSCAT